MVHFAISLHDSITLQPNTIYTAKVRSQGSKILHYGSYFQYEKVVKNFPILAFLAEIMSVCQVYTGIPLWRYKCRHHLDITPIFVIEIRPILLTLKIFFFPYLYSGKLRKNSFYVPSSKKSGSDLIRLWIINRIIEAEKKVPC